MAIKIVVCMCVCMCAYIFVICIIMWVCLSTAGNHFEDFWGSFWGLLLCFWDLLHILSYEILCRCFFCYSDNHSTNKNFTARVSLLGALCCIFVPILGTFCNALKHLKHSLDILHECLDITVVVTKLKFVLGLYKLLTFFSIFGPLCTIFLN